MTAAQTILLIEDDTWFAEQQTRVLVAAGFKIQHSQDGVTGIEAIDQLLPSLIVLDIFLPGPNAFVLLHELQSHSDLASIPVIICTSSAADLKTELLKAYGVQAVLDKVTMTPESLVGAVRKVLL